jgi:hypothetical protein
MRRWFKPDVLLGTGAFLLAFVLIFISRATILRAAKGIDLLSWQMLHELRPYLCIAAIIVVVAVADLIVDWKRRRDQSDPNVRDP